LTENDLSKNKAELLFRLANEGLTPEEYTLAIDPSLANKITEDQDSRVRHDKVIRRCLTAVGLSSFLSDPINFWQRGPSGVGKTFTTVETLKTFPQENILYLGGLSPKSLIHDHGAHYTEAGELLDSVDRPLRPKRSDLSSLEEFKEEIRLYQTKIKEYSEIVQNSYVLIELSHKILVFLQAPEKRTWELLYSILSHDKHEIDFRFVDRENRGGPMNTVRVRVRGWPATVFLSVEKEFMEEMATRGFSATPESTEEKITDANKLTNEKASFPGQFEESEQTKRIRNIMRVIGEWFGEKEADIIVPFPNLYELFSHSIIRDMRDFQHFIQLLKTITAMHLFQRSQLVEKDKRYVVASLHDVMLASSIYSQIFETTRTWTDRTLLEFFHSMIEQRKDWSLKDLTEEYNATCRQKISSNTMEKKLDRLAEIGYVNKEKSETDRRMNVYHPLKVEQPNELSLITCKQENQADVISKLITGFNSWLEKYLTAFPKYITNFSGEPLTPDTFTARVLDEKSMLLDFETPSGNFSLKNEPSNAEKEPMDTSNNQNQALSGNTSSPIMRGQVSLEDLATKTLKLERLQSDYDDKCCICGFTGRQVWQVTLFDGSWGFLCGPCGEKLEFPEAKE